MLIGRVSCSLPSLELLLCNNEIIADALRKKMSKVAAKRPGTH